MKIICDDCIYRKYKKVKDNDVIPNNIIMSVAYCDYLNKNLYYVDKIFIKSKTKKLLIYPTLFAHFLFYSNNNSCNSFVKK